MNWIFWMVAAVVVIGYFGLKKAGQVPAETARNLLRQGALIVDVRTPSEYSSKHLPRAINLPLDAVTEKASAILPDKHAPILVHCHSGGRSLIAQKLLRKQGYATVLNLGSYGRAETIVNSVEP